MEKILLALTVPVSLYLLALAFWKRNVWFGVAVLTLMAAGKVIWSIYNAGQAGASIVIPAVLGLMICIALIAFGYKRMNKSKNI